MKMTMTNDRQWTALRLECQSRTRRDKYIAGRLVFNEKGEYQYFWPENGPKPQLPIRVTLILLDQTIRVSLRTFLGYADPKPKD
jgi:hypothetical protein